METSVDTIIFDLGGVILDLDYDRTTKAFEALGLEQFATLYSQAAQTGIFDRFEKGFLSVNAFVNDLLNYLPKATSPNQLVAAWNAMIIDFPPANLELLLKLKSRYRIFLLSNTNELHIQYFLRKLNMVSPDRKMEDYFEKVYYSSDTGLRKPDQEIFEMVCAENHLNKEKTLFIDDTIHHIEGAAATGLKTLHFTKGAHHLPSLFS